MSAIDLYHTPDHVAQTILASVRSDPDVIADFSAGHGHLLRAAKSKWMRAEIIGTDISRAVGRVRTHIPDASVGVCNFLEPSSRSRCKALAKARSRVALAVLNPPFTCRGAKKVVTILAGHEVRCSVSLAFLINAFPYMRPKGEIVAVLPAGTIHAEKDRDGWAQVAKHATIKILGWNGNRTFNDCSPRTVMVHLKLRDITSAYPRVESAFPIRGRQREHEAEPREAVRRERVRQPFPKIRLFRGKQPMFTAVHAKGPQFLPLVHSTELRSNAVNVSKRRADPNLDAIFAPAVLLSRVGAPNREKLAILKKGCVVLSDCVFALCCGSKKEAESLFDLLFQEWDDIASCYNGTGARYLTIQSLTRWMYLRGYTVVAHRSASRQSSTAIRQAIDLVMA